MQRRPNVYNVHQEDLGGKVLLEVAKQTLLTKAKKAMATKKESMLTNCNLMHPALGKQPKEKEKQVTNGSSKMPPMNGILTKAQKMEAVVLGGNRTPTKDTTKAIKLSRSRELARPTKEQLTKVCTQTRLSEEASKDLSRQQSLQSPMLVNRDSQELGLSPKKKLRYQTRKCRRQTKFQNQNLSMKR